MAKLVAVSIERYIFKVSKTKQMTLKELQAVLLSNNLKVTINIGLIYAYLSIFD